jgi:hypothetical protein
MLPLVINENVLLNRAGGAVAAREIKSPKSYWNAERC